MKHRRWKLQRRLSISLGKTPEPIQADMGHAYQLQEALPSASPSFQHQPPSNVPIIKTRAKKRVQRGIEPPPTSLSQPFEVGSFFSRVWTYHSTSNWRLGGSRDLDLTTYINDWNKGIPLETPMQKDSSYPQTSLPSPSDDLAGRSIPCLQSHINLSRNPMEHFELHEAASLAILPRTMARKSPIFRTR